MSAESAPNHGFTEAVVMALLVLLMGGLCYGCKSWEYDECLSVGHSKTYCGAQAAGCFGRSGGRR